MRLNTSASSVKEVVPEGQLLQLSVSEIAQSADNPRQLFDPEPLAELKKNIEEHGVLVPITVYREPGQPKFTILDGARRYRCCTELEREGVSIRIPANIVKPPNQVAQLVYMFSIHNFREAWELMPTALALKTMMQILGEQDTGALSRMTGLSTPQIERCKIVLTFKEKYQLLSLDSDPKSRIPSNFWIELNPLLPVVHELLPDMMPNGDPDAVIDSLVSKYRNNGIKSVIHFRRVMEAYAICESETELSMFRNRLRQYILDESLETRRAFDEFVVDNRRIQGAIGACDSFIRSLERFKVDFTLDRADLRRSLTEVQQYVMALLVRLEGEEEPRDAEEMEIEQ